MALSPPARPLVATAVALLGAGVIVANPFVVSPPDVRVAAVSLAAGTRVNVLADEYLTGIGAALPASPDPVAATKPVLSQLLREADNAQSATIAVAFAAGVVALTDPNLIVGTPTSAANGDFNGALQSVMMAATAPLGPSSVVADAMRTLMAERLGSLTEVFPISLADVGIADGQPVTSESTDVSGVLSQLSGILAQDSETDDGADVAAAFASGALTVAEPAVIMPKLTAAANDESPDALSNVVVSTAPLDAPAVVADAVGAVIEDRLSDLEATNPVVGDVDTSENAAETPEVTSTDPALDATQAPAAEAAPTPGDESALGTAESAVTKGGDSVTDGQDSTGGTPDEPRTGNPSTGRLSEAFDQADERLRTTSDEIKDTLRRLAGLDQENKPAESDNDEPSSDDGAGGTTSTDTSDDGADGSGTP